MFKARLAQHVRTWLPPRGSVAAWILGAALILCGVFIRVAMETITNDPLPPYLTLYPMIVIAAFAGGVRIGLFAVLASAASAWLLWIGPPVGTALTPIRVLTGIVFLFTATITVLLSGLARILLDDAAAAQEMRARAAGEAVHRIRNLISVMQSLSRQASASVEDVAAYREQMDHRLKALAIAQDMLLQRDWGVVKLDDLVQAALGPFLPSPKIELRLGAEVAAPAAAVTGVAMALYELATNSMKYGALASPSGFVRVETCVREGRVYVEWREIGLAHVAVGESAGQGAALIQAALAGVAGGLVRHDVSPHAVSCVLGWPLGD